MALVDGREGELEGDVPVGVADGPLVGGVERRLVLVDEDAVRPERLVAGSVELAGEESLGGTVGVGRVDDDEIIYIDDTIRLFSTINWELIDEGIQEEWVYDLETENHMFFANDILVHNSCYVTFQELMDNSTWKGSEYNSV